MTEKPSPRASKVGINGYCPSETVALQLGECVNGEELVGKEYDMCASNSGKEELEEITEVVGNDVNIVRGGENTEFESLITGIKQRMRAGVLRHNKSNVDLVLKAIAASPWTEQYPHPALNKLFEKQMDNWRST